MSVLNTFICFLIVVTVFMTVLALSDIFCQELALSVILNCKEQRSKDPPPDSLEQSASLSALNPLRGVEGQRLQLHRVWSPQRQTANVLGKRRFVSDSYHRVSDSIKITF